MADAKYLDGIAEVMKADAIVAEAEPKFGRLNPLQPLYVAFLRCDKAGETVPEVDCRVAVDGANVSTGLQVQAIFFAILVWRRS